jgi:hypothetical protein
MTNRKQLNLRLRLNRNHASPRQEVDSNNKPVLRLFKSPAVSPLAASLASRMSLAGAYGDSGKSSRLSVRGFL